MRRRAFLALAGGWAVVVPRALLAQAKIYRVGLLNRAAPVSDASPFGSALVRNFARLGYVQGKNLAFERRGADFQVDRLPRLVEELAESKVDVIIAIGYPAALAAKQHTQLPVVVFSAGDPVGGGLVDGLARPGGHLTGISDVSAELTPKRMELLKEVAPALRRIAVLWNADDVGMTLRYQASESGARAMGIGVQALGVRRPADFDGAFDALNRDKPDALLVVADGLTSTNRKRIFDFVATHRLPAIYEEAFLVRDGGLMSYGPDLDESLGRVAGLVDRVLKGAKPADLPFEQPTLYRLAVNLKTARAIGLELPSSFLLRADEVIE